MTFFQRALIARKYAAQFGLRPLVLYARYKLGLISGYYKRTDAAGDAALMRLPITNYHSLFSLPSREQLQQILGEESKARLLGEADEILRGKFRMFGGEPAPIKLTVDQALQHWTAYERSPSLLSSLSSSQPDIKFIWEPARFGWAFTLGRAYHLMQDVKYAEGFWKFFELFNASNPINMGPHWMNGQEIAIRMLALVWAAHVFETAPATSPERRVKLIQCIFAHATRIPRTFVYARAQDNNHLLSESVALYTAGLMFENPTWRALGWKWFQRGISTQISNYGEYIQHSTNYHRVMLQLALWMNMIKRDVFPTGIAQPLARSAHWLFSLVDNISGRTPNLGSNDGALVFPLSASAFDDFRPTVQAAARAFLRSGLPAGVWDEMSLWFGLAATKREADSSAYLTDNLRARNSWAYLRASDFKSRLGHMDQLHLDLWWHGLNVAQDAGTYQYNAEPPWDNSLVTTRVHNTVTVDGHDQMTRAGRFLVLDWADAFSKPVIELDEKILHSIKAQFTGFQKYGVRCERTVTVYEDEFWEVQDRLLNWRRRPHTYRLHWLLIDGEWNFYEDSHAVNLQITTTQGKVQLTVRRPANFESRVSLVRAGELLKGERQVQPYEGWYSRTYGQKSPALSFALDVTSEYHTTLVSEFTFSA